MDMLLIPLILSSLESKEYDPALRKRKKHKGARISFLSEILNAHWSVVFGVLFTAKSVDTFCNFLNLASVFVC